MTAKSARKAMAYGISWIGAVAIAAVAIQELHAGNFAPSARSSIANSVFLLLLAWVPRPRGWRGLLVLAPVFVAVQVLWMAEGFVMSTIIVDAVLVALFAFLALATRLWPDKIWWRSQHKDSATREPLRP